MLGGGTRGMHHLYTGAKGDPVCPLGFHPQVRWPTRCKRCLRDYKEHGGARKEDSLRKDDVTASSPALSSTSTSTSRYRDGLLGDAGGSKGWNSPSSSQLSHGRTSASSWTSTPDLQSLSSETTSKESATARLSKWTSSSSSTSSPSSTISSSSSSSQTHSAAKPPIPPSSVSTSTSTSSGSDSELRRRFNERRRSTELAQGTSTTSSSSSSSSTSKSSSSESSTPLRSRRLLVQEVKTIENSSVDTKKDAVNPDVEFIIRVKSSASKAKEQEKEKERKGKDVESDDDDSSVAATDTTDTTLVGAQVGKYTEEEVESMKQELSELRARCEKAEREKSDLLLRRITAAAPVTSRPSSSEVMRLQQKVNDLSTTKDKLEEERRSLNSKVEELSEELEKLKSKKKKKKTSDTSAASLAIRRRRALIAGRTLSDFEEDEEEDDSEETKKLIEDLKNKLSAAEQLCEELMDENKEIKKEMRDLEEEMEEMQDNFREDQVDEYTSLKKELEQTAKNCRILQFKLRKSERRAETLETERNEALSNLAAHAGTGVTETQKKLEHELSLANQVSLRLQSEVETLQEKLKEVEEGKKKTGTEEVRKKAPKLAALAKSSSGERPTRESLTRGGSQDDPAQLLRDLQDSMEREADLREQLRFAEEEAQNLRQKLSRVEDDNESLVAQLKRMAAKSRSSRKQSPSPARLTPEPSLEKDEGISEDDDPAELRLQLELNEQETAVLRRKVEELEREGETTKKHLKELQDKLAEKKTTPLTAALKDTTPAKGSAISEQKIKVLEEEANELRKKLIEKERDCERLHAELTLTQKRSKGMQRSRSLDSGGGTGTMDQAAFDLKRQLQVVEQEANILRTKTQELESECEKLNAENKKLSLSKAAAGKRTAEIKTLRERVKELEAKLESSELGKGSSVEGDLSGNEESNKSSLDVEEMKVRLEKAEAEVEHLNSELKKAKDPKSMLLRKRTAKRPTDLTPKPQMKKMVEELEIEIAELLVVLKNTDAEKTRLAEEIKKKDSGKKDISEEAKLDWEKDKAEKEKFAKELEDTKAKLLEAEKEKKKLQKEKAGVEEDLKKKKDEEILKLKESKAKAEQERKKLEKEKVDLEEEVKKLKAEKDSSSNKWEDELKSMTERMDNLRREVEMERSSSDDAKTKLEEMKSAAQKDKAQLDKELMEKTKKISDMEKKMKETEDKLKKTERLNNSKKEKLAKLEKEVQEEREKSKKLEERQKEVSVGWLKEREELKKESEEAQIKVAELEAQIQLLEGNVQDEQMKTKELQLKVGQSEKESEVVKELQDELTALKKQLEEANQKLEKSEKTRKSNEEKLKKAEAEMKKDKGKGKEDNSKEVERLEQELANERRAYEDLTTKYEMLEEDYVVTKAQLVSEKEAAESQLFVTKHEMDSLDEELDTLRDSFNSKQDVWIKEKVDLQERLKEAEEKASRAANNNETWNAEKNRLRDSLDEKTKEADQLRRESEVINDQINHLRKENEELKSKLEDFDKVVKVQRSMAADTSALEKQLREIKNTLSLEEKNHKTEISSLKMRYENRISLLNQELESSQNTASRFRRERDAQRHLLEAAQKSMAELRKSSTGKAKGVEPTGEDLADDMASRLASLEQEVACLEDELSEARLDKSRLKTELVNERSAWEVKIAEMQSRVNELEEERILSSGRKGIVGVRTRMELAWTKEREEQHRLLQETSTLARDLRQTLFEVERERDKERLEAKRKTDQMKKSMEDEREENKKKLVEIQNDLLELRDAHAKLRTTNEKLRRDREKLQERIEKEREETKIGTAVRKKKKIEEEGKVAALLEQVDALMRLAPELFPQQQKTTQDTSTAPTTPHVPKRTKGPRSRENSPMLERKELKREGSVTSLSAEEEKRGHQLQWALQRLTEATEELRRSHQRALSEDRQEITSKRGLGIRRAASTESEPDDSSRLKSSTLSRIGGVATKKKGSLYRKSISLEQTGGHPVGSASEQSIWKTDEGSTSSLQSIEMGSEILDDRYPSLDRLSAGSTQSELGTTKKKKTGILGKLKKLTKSKSIDESNLKDYDGSTQGGSVISSASEISVEAEPEDRGRGKDLKGKISGLFKKSGSRSSSKDRGSSEKVGSNSSESGALSTQRPLSRTGISRPSPARSDTSHTSSTSRPLAASAVTRTVINRK